MEPGRRRVGRGRAGGLALDELGVEQQGADGDAAHQAAQGVVGAAADFLPLLADGGHGRIGVGAEGEVVKADDAQVPGDRQAPLLCMDHQGVGQEIVAAENGGYALAQKPGEVSLETLGEVEGVAGQGGGVGHLVGPEGLEKGAVALLIDVGAQSAAEIADLPVPQLFQVAHREAHGLEVVHADIGRGRVDLDVVVVEHGGRAAALELPEPGVRETHAQEHGPSVVALQHIGVVVKLLLQVVAERLDDHLAAVRLGHFPEAQDDVIAEVLGGFVGHVFDKYNKSGGLAPAHGPVVAQLHGGFQDRFAHCFG